MSLNFKPTTRGMSRVQVIEGRARPDHEPDYQGCLMVGAPDRSFGDVSPIQCPSPDSFRQYEEVGQIRDALERATSSLVGHLPLDVRSTLHRLARERCAHDVQVNFGTCTDPTDNNVFTKKWIFEQAFFTTYSTTEPGSLQSEDESAVDETSEFSAKDWYEVMQLNVAERGADIVQNPLEDVVICSMVECGDCDDEDDGCEIIYAVGDSGPGSPGTAPDVIYSIDRGVTLAADEITTMVSTENADALACVGDYVVVVSNDDGGIHYKTKADINAGTGFLWTRNATNIAVGGEPNDIWSVGTYAFIVGDAGYVYGISHPATITVLDAGVATTDNLGAVHALNKNFAVAVGANGAVVYTKDRTTWQAATVPAAVTLAAVWIKNELEWHVGASSDGSYYYTLDGGLTWTAQTTFPVTLTGIYDIAFSNDSVAYLAGVIAGPAGVILRSYDGGQSWVSLPEGVGSIPENDQINAVAACKYDANFVVGVGIGGDAADGVYLVGEDNPA